MRTPEETEKHNRHINELAMKELKPDHVIVQDMPEERIAKYGIIAELKTATKDFTCKVSGEVIKAGTMYYAAVFAGSGIGGLKYPARIRIEHLNKYLEKYRDG